MRRMYYDWQYQQQLDCLIMSATKRWMVTYENMAKWMRHKLPWQVNVPYHIIGHEYRIEYYNKLECVAKPNLMAARPTFANSYTCNAAFRLTTSCCHRKISGICCLRSSCRNRLTVPSVKLTLGSRSFSVSGPTVWNALPDYLRNPTLSIDVFKRYLKTFLFAQY